MSEATDQIALFDLLKRLEGQLPLLRFCLHIPNGEKRDKATAARLKAMGVRRGAPDILFPIRNQRAVDRLSPRECVGLVIELKTDIGRLSTAQEDWMRMFVDEGWYTAVCRDWTDAARLIVAWVGGDPGMVEGL